jgi:HlyD family secretion protein
MKMKKNPGIIYCLLLLLILFDSCNNKDVSLKEVHRGKFTQTIVETGELVAVNSKSFVLPRYGRYWYEMKVIGLLEHGTIVKAGDSLMSFDPSEIKKFVIERETQLENEEANLAKLRVEVDNRKSELESVLKNEEAMFNLKKLEMEQYRFEPQKIQEIKKLEFKQSEIKLAKEKSRIALNKIIADNDLRIQELRVSQLEKEVTNARKVLPELTLRTPIPGIFQVANRNNDEKIKLGDEIYYGTVLGSVPDLTWMKVNTTINETDIDKMKLGAEVNVRLDALPKVVFKGKISFISKLCYKKWNTSQKVFDVEVKMDESDQRLKPGMTVSCEFICKQFDNVFYVPNDCILKESGRQYLFIRKGSGYVKTEVVATVQNNNFTKVEGDLLEGEELIPIGSISQNLKN